MNNVKLFNGYGGFNKSGDEYTILNTKTPVPWCNILSNSRFGTLISSFGTVYSFYKNASEYKLTSWCNDWANFTPGEEFKGIFDVDYNLTYGFGYVVVTEEQYSITRKMDIFVPVEDDVKVQYLTLTNNRLLDKEVTIEYSVDMVLGVAKEFTSRYVLSKIINKNQNEEEKNNSKDTILLFKNPYSDYFSSILSYLKIISYGNSTNDTMSYDEEKQKAVIHVVVKAGETRNIAILFGATDQGENEINRICEKYSDEKNVKEEYIKTKEYWRGKVIKDFDTSNKYLDIMANGWLLYQTICCRLYARTGLYQAGGAFGYRDQLQDAMAVISTFPELTKSQIIKHSQKQFEQGDVLHWWHEHNGAGIRTLFSDDYLWLPYVLSEYLSKTNDNSLLKIKTKFLEDKPLDNQNERYDVYNNIDKEATIYEHAILAIKYGLSRKGKNGLLSIGDGDWNDGFSNVKGESVWLTFFMMDILERFSKVAHYMGDDVNRMHFLSERHSLKHAVISNAYKDGYFVRAFYPDGTPLGSMDSPDCKIDIISQAWAAIALKDYTDCQNEIKSCMKKAEEYLVDKKNKIVKLLYPPFDEPKNNPGYIKAYVPGVRENGGQYTHAAIWFAKAYFEMGEKAKAMEILSYINPITHGDSEENIDIYKVEPYVVAADVYATPEHVGRGGWTWYTGSAGWMYKVIEDNFSQRVKKDKETVKKAKKNMGKKI